MTTFGATGKLVQGTKMPNQNLSIQCPITGNMTLAMASCSDMSLT
ncbi:hypothetical protein SP41_49 [Salmonella phage 41]|nr:hypothetical protein SP41_49 [Salmonella phage 41]